MGCKLSSRGLYLCSLVLPKAHRVLVVLGAAWVEVVHLNAAGAAYRSATHQHLLVVVALISSARACVLHRAELRIARTSCFHPC